MCKTPKEKEGRETAGLRKEAMAPRWREIEQPGLAEVADFCWGNIGNEQRSIR